MFQSGRKNEGGFGADVLHFMPTDEDRMFDENIDAYDDEMDNANDGIVQSDVDLFEEDLDDEDGDDDEDYIAPGARTGESADYDELEE